MGLFGKPKFGTGNAGVPAWDPSSNRSGKPGSSPAARRGAVSEFVEARDPRSRNAALLRMQILGMDPRALMKAADSKAGADSANLDPGSSVTRPAPPAAATMPFSASSAPLPEALRLAQAGAPVSGGITEPSTDTDFKDNFENWDVLLGPAQQALQDRAWENQKKIDQDFLKMSKQLGKTPGSMWDAEGHMYHGFDVGKGDQKSSYYDRNGDGQMDVVYRMIGHRMFVDYDEGFVPADKAWKMPPPPTGAPGLDPGF